MDIIYTTLAQIRAHNPCEDGWKELNKTLGLDYGENTPLTFKQIYDSNGYDDTLWCLRAVDPKWYPLWRHFACDCADDIRHLMTDERSTNAIDVARRHADSLASDEELAAAGDAAGDAWDAWDAAWSSARDAAWDAAKAAAAWDAARAAWSSARDAAWDAAKAAAARDAAWSAAARDAQMQRLFEYCRTGERLK